jgi:hypothetical protein
MATTTRALARFFALMGCVLFAASCSDPPPARDGDGDGVDATDDCNDSNAGVHPGAAEFCDDKLDNDCDLMVDAADSDCMSGEGS